jgi:hypothetical protein
MVAIVGLDGEESKNAIRDDRCGSWWSSLLRLCSDPKSRHRTQGGQVRGLYAHGVLALKLHEDDGFTVTEVAALIQRDKGQTSRLIRQTGDVLRRLIDPAEPLIDQLTPTTGTPFHKLTDEQWGGIAPRFPAYDRQRATSPTSRQMADALRFVIIYGGKWRHVPRRVGIGHVTVKRRIDELKTRGELDNVVRVLRATDDE